MAPSGRGSLLGCVCCFVLMLVLADVIAAHDHIKMQTDIPDNLKKAFFRRGDVATGKEATLAETIFSESSIEAFARRELNDYGTTPATANPRSNCRRRRPCRPR
ncbi:uncharacterized protein [Physcomitrium patens]|uniref:Uncharacterized protein n=1 Tax=Physcomitrium patens TaxID=3218 RepID=A9RXR4_PHYPA|nr:uncharacterized protein LOC112291864 [Physcomitrium patens]PNR41451.1 hypothetical protein PHYPA_018854 [Physcomitrium patens]|eukprot:XP_024395560.1 uncharacterized protein LOC112291864 [Physcomitrella patens]